MKFCAICADDIVGIPHREPLGRDDALVDVCDDCATTTPRAFDSERGYEEQAAMSQSEMLARVTKLAASTGYRADWQFQVARPLTSGWILVKALVRGPDGKTRDSHEAARSLAHHPWARQLRTLGSTRDLKGCFWHLFERPPASRPHDRSENPLAWLEPYRTETT